MFNVTPHLAGVCPWTLFDYRSTSRLHPVYQGGYNRKGLISEHGEKKEGLVYHEGVLRIKKMMLLNG